MVWDVTVRARLFLSPEFFSTQNFSHFVTLTRFFCYAKPRSVTLSAISRVTLTPPPLLGFCYAKGLIWPLVTLTTEVVTLRKNGFNFSVTKCFPRRFLGRTIVI